jgi:prephenate dehydratase
MIVAIQGEIGSFSEAAVRVAFGDAAEILSCASFDDLFAAVASGGAELGAVPVRNTITGSVYDNALRVQGAGFQVVGSLHYPVRQCLIARHGTTIESLRRVASHPVALLQCSRFFAARPHLTAVPVSDTASGVRDLMLDCLDADAAIGSAAAARRYEAVVLVDGVEDNAQNFTEFLLIASSLHK